MFQKSENAIRWTINLYSLSYQSMGCNQMSVSEIRLKADATTCVLMSTLNCLHKPVCLVLNDASTLVGH